MTIESDELPISVRSAVGEQEASEPIRLVVWDLDDTFWNGTLAEGPIDQIPDNHLIVRKLAARGILSSICSLNDPARVEPILSELGLWEYFVFPSISWDPKGPRLQGLIEAVQLRPASILLIDDNPSRLQEARYFVPELQVAGTEILRGILSNPALAGKPDGELTRLRQYQALQQRHLDRLQVGSRVEQFLRDSDIRVEIEHDVMSQLDRAIELINRTNQLNFTKQRLPEDPIVARGQLAEALRSHDVQAGLVRVIDRYGDHGYAGFYMLRNGKRLLHYCFSCRVLGMGVEAWLYRQLGRPHLTIVGEVRGNPSADTVAIDWISVASAAADKPDASLPKAFDWVLTRGGCELSALSHYFRVNSSRVIGEFNVGRCGYDARIDHSMLLRYALEGLSDEGTREFAKLGYTPEDFQPSLTQSRPGNGLIILSFWADTAYALYRHRELGILLPFALSGVGNHALDARAARDETLPKLATNPWLREALSELRRSYDYRGLISRRLFKENLNIILQALPKDTPTAILLANSRLRDAQGNMRTHSYIRKFNRWTVEVSLQYPMVCCVDIRDAICSEEEVSNWLHFDRIVYHRLYRLICEKLMSRPLRGLRGLPFITFTLALTSFFTKATGIS